MNLSDVPLLSMLREQMSWLADRQSILSQNVANADVQGYERRDLKPLDFSDELKQATAPGPVTLATADPRQIAPPQTTPQFEEIDASEKDASGGNGAEEEMMNVSDTQAKYQAAANIYAKSIQMMRTAIDR